MLNKKFKFPKLNTLLDWFVLTFGLLVIAFVLIGHNNEASLWFLKTLIELKNN